MDTSKSSSPSTRTSQVPADAQAVTISNSILTDRQIELTPPYRGGPTLKDHDTIGLNRTKTPVEFARVLDVLDKLSGSLRGDGQGNGPVADLVNASAAIADGNGQEMKDALGELSNALRLSADGGAVDPGPVDHDHQEHQLAVRCRRRPMTRRCASSARRSVQLSQILADENLGSGTHRQESSTEVITTVGESSTPIATRSSRSSPTATPR